ncbi:MAG: hypothetical protein WCE62_05430 [Polyangiales bacterium]
MAKAGQTGSLAAWLWVLIAGAAVFELVAQPVFDTEIPTDASWERASAFVRARYQPTDRIVAAPSWVDPIVRNHLGDLLTLRMAAPTDLAGIDRIWELGIRGASTRDDTPALEEQFDGVRVRMWFLSTDEILYDFVEEVERATVELVRRDDSQICPFVTGHPARGGLGHGPMPPKQRFVCDPQRPWLWVGATVLADLDLQPRRCVWQHPAGTDPIRVMFSEALLGERLVIHAGVDYHAERERAHGAVTLRVWIDERLAGELIHRDGDGWSSLDIETAGLRSRRATVRFETTADDPSARLFCWSASTRIDPKVVGGAPTRAHGGATDD